MHTPNQPRENPGAPPRASARSGAWPWLALLLGLLLGAVSWHLLRPQVPAGAAHPAPDDVRSLRQALATAQTNDAVSRKAIQQLQADLRTRDAEIARLKEDLALYERFAGTTAQRQPLSVDRLQVRQRADGLWAFTAVVARSDAADAELQGRLTMAVEGRRAGKLETLDWTTLRQGDTIEGAPFSLRYFQRVEGTFALPPGFQPARVLVKLKPVRGGPVEKSFDWAPSVQ